MKQRIVNIPFNWTMTNGEGAVVMICDTGCDIKHPAIVSSIVDYRAFSQRNMATYTRHGTHIAGIIAGNSSEICGVAPNAKLIIAQVMKGSVGNYVWLIPALEWAMTLNIDVLNLSFAYTLDNRDVKRLLGLLSEKGVIIVSAFAKHPYIYPSSYPFVVSVASFSDSSTTTTEKIDIFAHNEFKSSVQSGKYDVIKGNSMATAYFSGVAALAKAYDKKTNIVKLLNELSRINGAA